jgi:acylphosphatase
MEKLARHVRLTGLVQGVFFRAWTRDEANALRITGWVRNCTDGSLEAHVEGEAEDVEELIDLMREGPPGARVDKVEVGIADPEGHSGFEVSH